MAFDSGTFSCDKAFGDYTRASKPRDITFLPAGETVSLDANKTVHILSYKYRDEKQGNWAAYHCLAPSTLTGPLLYSAKDAQDSKLSFKDQFLSMTGFLDFFVLVISILFFLVVSVYAFFEGNIFDHLYVLITLVFCTAQPISFLLKAARIKNDRTYIARRDSFNIPSESLFALGVDTKTLSQYALPAKYRSIPHSQ